MFHGSSPVGDWSVLLERLDRAGVFPRWQLREPALSVAASPADLPGLTGRGVDRGDADRILGALVRIAALDGPADADAALVLVHLLSDGIWALAARLYRGQPPHRTVPLVVGELTCRIRSFPWRRRRTAYAANLLLDTKHALLQEEPARRPDGARREIPVAPCDPAWTSFPQPDGADPGPAVDLPVLLDWAHRNNVAGADDLRMLMALHERAGYGTGSRHRIAAEFGINERTLRRRRDRTLTALRAAGPRFLQEQAA